MIITWRKKTDEFDQVTLERVAENGKIWSVPETPGNRHYEEYLEWLSEGNEPEVIEEA